MGQHSRRKILECAREMFYHVGYESTSIDDILSRSGVARSNFYYHFKSKEELAIAVLEIREREMDLLLIPLRESDLEPCQRLQRFFDAFRALQEGYLQRGGCPFGSFAAALSTGNDETATRFRAEICTIFRHVEGVLQVCIEDGVRSGQFRQDILPEEMAGFVLASLEGLLILTRARRDLAPFDVGSLVLQRLLKSV